MKAITLRNLPPELARLIEEIARRDKTSLNKTVIKLLAKSLGVSTSDRPVEHHDLDELAGSWSDEEASDFDRNLALQRTIDSELWS